MATRSYIWKKVGDKWKGIYCHWDGDPGNVGKILSEYYTDEDKIDQLISLGDISFLGREICKSNNYEKPNYNCVLAYHRDRGDPWEDVTPLHAKSIDEAIRLSDKFGGVNYAYFWDGKQWNCYNYYTHEWVIGDNPEKND